MKKKNPQEKSRCVVYIPPDSELNFDPFAKKPPITQYEKRRTAVGKDAFKKVVKGKYGND